MSLAEVTGMPYGIHTLSWPALHNAGVMCTTQIPLIILAHMGLQQYVQRRRIPNPQTLKQPHAKWVSDIAMRCIRSQMPLSMMARQYGLQLRVVGQHPHARVGTCIT